MSAKQQIFRRGLEFIFVKHTRLSATEVAKPGDPCDGMREYHLRSLYRRRRIGVKGSDWVKEMLDGTRRPEIKKDAPALDPSTLPADEPATMRHLGGGVWEITKGAHIEMVKPKKAAQARCDELDELAKLAAQLEEPETEDQDSGEAGDQDSGEDEGGSETETDGGQSELK